MLLIRRAVAFGKAYLQLDYDVFMGKRFLYRRQTTSNNRNPILSEIELQISATDALVIPIITAIFVMAICPYVPMHTAVAAAEQGVTSLVKISNTSSLVALAKVVTINNTFPTLGSPFVVYKESDNSSAPSPMFINGTHAQATAFKGNGTLAGMPDTDTGTAYLVTRRDGSVYTFGNGAVVSKMGNGILTYRFDAIGHYLHDGKLHDTGHVIVKSTSGNLASFSDMIGLYKDWYDRSGKGMTTMWFWEG